ncbi:MAG TPA: hypothetical protein PK743_05870 [Luteimonas sp.]|nr:hypothetical protein [Luteimonas sp.]HRO28117.1 hypothetical protein [Luteimonas sp.]HRP72145.1 hypothetical protein [Luteimonas sp.]
MRFAYPGYACWYEAFGVEERDALWIAPGERADPVIHCATGVAIQ